MPSGGGGQSSTTTVDPEYNKGLLKLAEEDQGFKRTFMNMFKYGVDYDPNETVRGKTINGKWYNEDQLKTMGVKESGGAMIENPEWVKWNEQNKAGLLNGQMTYGNNGEGAAQYQNQQAPEPQRYIQNENALESKTYGEINGYDPNAQTSEMQYLQDLVDANSSLLGLQTDVSKKELNLAGSVADASKSLLPYQTDAAKYGAKLSTAQSKAGLQIVPLRTNLAKTFLKDVNAGIDVNDRMDRAQADVQHGFQLANEAQRKDISSYGLDPSAGRYASQNRATEMAQAAGVAGARTKARTNAETEDFERKKAGLQIQY